MQTVTTRINIQQHKKLCFSVCMWLFSCLFGWSMTSAKAQVELSISDEDEKVILKDARLSHSGQHYKMPGCDDPLNVKLDVVDLNADGKAEVILRVFGSPCFSGLIESNVSIYVRSSNGIWREVLGFLPAFGVQIEHTRNKGYADLVLTVLGGCDPVYRWTGYAYIYTDKRPSYQQRCGR